MANWTVELFTIVDAHRSDPPVYRLMDWHGEKLDGTFYEPELQKVIVQKGKTYRVESVLRWRNNLKALATTLNRDKSGPVKFAYEPVTQKFVAHVKIETKFTLYGDLHDILGFGTRSFASSLFVRAYSIVDLRRGFESLSIRASSNPASSATRLHRCCE